jgi:DNA-binding Lrp family transcriptional regulator
MSSFKDLLEENSSPDGLAKLDRTTLQMLEREARLPFTATLRTTDANMLAANDTIVGCGVEARDQLEATNERVSIEIAEAYPRQLSSFRPGVVKYTYLTGQYGTWRVVEKPTPLEGSDQYELELERESR